MFVLAHGGHEHGDGDMSIWEDAWSIITDPGHAIAEIFYSISIEIILFPLIILFYKKIIEPRLHIKIHKEIDKEHGYVHKSDGSVIKEKNIVAEKNIDYDNAEKVVKNILQKNIIHKVGVNNNIDECSHNIVEELRKKGYL